MARSALCLLAFALCAFAQVFSASTGSGPDVEQLLKELQTSIDKSVSDAKKTLNLPEHPDGAAIVKAIKEQAINAEKALNDMEAKLVESVKKSPEINAAFDGLKAKIDEAKEKLKKENPEVAANAQKVADNLKAAYETVGKELEKINAEINKKGGVKDDFGNLLKNLIDRGTAAAKDFQTKVEAAVKEVTSKKE